MNKRKRDLNRTRERLRALGLPHAAEQLEGVLSDPDNTSSHQVLDTLLDTEISVRETPRIKTSPPTEEGNDIWMYVAWVLASLFFIVLGYLLEHQWEFDYKFWSHISTEIGIAFAVALILALTIDRLLKKREQDRSRREKEAIKRDVFEHVLGYRLPEGTFDELDNQILNARFIRKDFAVTYKLSPLPEPFSGFVKINGQISYKVANMTPERHPFEFTTYIEKAPVEALKDLVKFTSVTIRQEDSPRGPPLDLTRKLHDQPPPNHLMIKEQIEIPGNRHASATIRFEIVRPIEGGSSFILTPLQALGLQLKVEAFGKVEVLATPFLREDLTEGDQHLPDQDSYHWELKRPILPNQGVYLTWKSKVGADLENRADGVQT